MDDNVFFIFGEASLQLISIFTLIYLQNEINEISKLLEKIPSKLLSIRAMWLAYCLMFLSTYLTDHWMRMIISILLIITLSIGINYTYKDYTIDEGFYISIPYFIIYSCLIFIFGITEYSGYTFDSSTSFIIFLSSLVCYILFASNILFGIELHTSYLNYIAFLGLVVSTFNIRFIITHQQNQEIKSIVDLVMFQLVHIYQYLTHLLSVKFEFNLQSESL
ncbi:hypothetical protein I4U23_024837 [Adineta vaga]|nr:hypothetical protein I4U23_024837 [Adineta vaga]